MEKKKKKKILKVLSIILAALVLLIIILSVIGGEIAEKYAREFLAKKTLKGHIITFEDIDINLATLSVSIDNIMIFPDTASPLIKNPDSLALMTTYYIRTDRVDVNRIRLWKIFNSKIVHVGMIYLKHPDIHVILPDKEARKNYTYMDQHMPVVSMEDVKAPPPVKYIQAGVFEIYKGSVKIAERGHKKPITETREYSIKIKQAKFDLEITTGFEDAVSYKDIKFNAQGETASLPGGFYNIYVGEVNMDYKKSHISIDTFKLIPQYGKSEFGYKSGKQTDRFDIMVERIDLNGVRTEEMKENKSIDINEIVVNGANLDIYRDKNIPRDLSIFPKYLNQVILSMSLPLNIDSLKVLDSYILYQEVAEGEEKTGKIFLSDVNLKVSNITNDPIAIVRNGSMLVQGELMIYGKGKLDIIIDMSLKNKKGEFTFSGNIGKMALKGFNPFIEPAMKMLILDGQVERAVFRAKADENDARGTMRFLYQDLTMEVVKKKESEEGPKKAGFLSDIANIVVRPNNPPRNKTDRVALMQFTRDKNKNFINLMAKTIINGLVSTILPGNKNILTKDMENVKNIDEIKTKGEVKEEKKEEKKGERKRRRGGKKED